MESASSSLPTAQKLKISFDWSLPIWLLRANHGYSPYTSSPAVLRIGQKQNKYYVPRELLQNREWITSDLEGKKIVLSDIDENTGHILVHFLHTGTYQMLDNIKKFSSKKVHLKFKRALMAYIAANVYGIAGLEQLAMEKMEHYGTEMSIFNVVDAIDEESLILPNTAWFQDYLDTKVKSAFEEDYGAFARDDFFGRISNVALHKVLVKCVMDLFSDKVSCMIIQERDVTEGAVKDSTNDEFAVSTEDPVKEVAFEPPIDEAVPSGIDINQPKIDKNVMDAGELKSPAFGFESRFGWGFGMRGTKSKLASQKVDEEHVVSSEPALLAKDAWDSFQLSTVKKGKKGKKGKKKVAADEPLPPPSEPEPTEEVQFIEPKLEPEPLVAIEDKTCPDLARHLIEGGTWKDCKPCRAFIQQAAVQIARTSPTSEDGYEMVNQRLG